MDETSRKLRTVASRESMPPRNQTPPKIDPPGAPDSQRGEGNVLPLEPARTRSNERGRKPGRRAPRAPIEEQIGRQLRAIYDDVLAQPVPDRFLDLLAQLEAQSGKKDDGA